MKLPALLFVLCLFNVAAPLLAAEMNPDMHFDAFDKNDDNFISKDEFVGIKILIDKDKVLLLFPNMANSKQLREEEFRARLFEELDLNHDGLLSHNEADKILPNILQLQF